MGASCSSSKSSQVNDSIKGVTLTPEAINHLKHLNGGKDCLSKDQIQKLVRKGQEDGKDQSVDDLDIPISSLSLEGKNKRLWLAIEKNEINLVEKLLNQYNADNQLQESDLYDLSGQSMIHKSASMGHVEILMVLLERTGAKPDLVNSQLASPLHLACKNNRENVARFLIGCGVDINVQDEHGQTPLLICCIHGHLELASLIVESSLAGHTPEQLEIDMKDHRGLTPLNCAAIKGDLRLCILLLERGGSLIEEASPKGCTPLLYAARGGYSEVVRYLLERGASPLKQDTAGGTVLHHAVEKGHMEVLQVLIEHGVDVYSAIEISDNGGRTPIFEAIDNNVSVDMVRLLTNKRNNGGLGAQVNVVNYNGQTPLFSAVREGNIDVVKLLIEEAGAKVDLSNSEQSKEDDEGQQQQEEEEYESMEEKYFMEGYRNATTPLHVACILGYDSIVHYLIEKGANPNKQNKNKGYACLHLAVLANKPEMIIELLTRTNANAHMPDYSGRTLQDMVEIFIPDYLEQFNALLENLQIERIKRAESESVVVATHYYNPEDDRQIKGVESNDIYQQQQDNESPNKDDFVNQEEEMAKNPQKKFTDMADVDIEVEEGRPFEREVENIFGRKIALGLIAINWKIKEVSMKVVYKQTEKFISKDHDLSINLSDFIKASTIAIDLTCKEKVIKVFALSLQLMSLIITSNKVEESLPVIECFKNTVIERNIVMKLLQKSEESNTRMTNKIHECLLDFSFHPKIGEAHCSSFILQRIQAHNKASLQKSKEEAGDKSNSGSTLGSFKGLLAQLALLYKFVNSFGVSVKKRGPLNVGDVMNAVLISVQHQNQDVRSAATKIIIDIHRLTGCINERSLDGLNDKVKLTLLEKLSQVVVEVNEESKLSDQQKYNNDQEESSDKIDLNQDLIQEAQELIVQKGQSKDWTEREIALKHMKDSFVQGNKKQLLEEEFLTKCTILLKGALEENNISIYLQAVDVAELFFQKTLTSDIVIGALPTLIKAVVMKTTDTNTRVRKKSVELINQLWNSQLSINNKNEQSENDKQNKKDSISIVIAEVLCDQSLQEKSIIGRLGLFIKKATSIDNVDELNKRPHQIILGRNYEQLVEFACQWSTHKNTKVRQNALKLILELCRMNSLDPRGIPFKHRIINYILGLRSSIRDPLVKKINEVCLSQSGQLYIDVNELELNLATKTRSASLDIHKRRVLQEQKQPNSNLPEIGNQSILPNVKPSIQSLQAILVLPHSEPLSEEQKDKCKHLIDLFSVELMTCFYSSTWSTRLAAIEKVGEQLHNIDPNRRDTMSAEINRKNIPIEENYKTFLEFIEEGTKDPVLKNFIAILDLLQQALPVFFRYLHPSVIKKELMPLVSAVIKKTADLKAKVRESTINFCLYLSHQSPIGPEAMVMQVISELDAIQSQSSSNAATSLGNSHMVASCIKLLVQFQTQTKILESQKPNQEILKKFINVINLGLKHQNPQVRKEAESLFKLLYLEFGDKLDSQLVGQKSQISQKLLQEAKQESGKPDKDQQQTYNLQKAQIQIRTEFINQSSQLSFLKGAEESLQMLKLPNSKKRLKAIIDIKKAIQKEMVNVNEKTAREQFEPLTLLLRQLMQDENTDIYLESLNVLKFVVGSLAPYLSTLDLHMMMGQFIGLIVNNTVSSNMRSQMASDKVIIFFAKHNNIGPLIVAKDVLKNIEKIIKSVQVHSKKEDQQSVVSEKRHTLLRFISLLSLMLQHFSVVLCYQTEFYDKCTEQLSDLLIISTDDSSIKSVCVQIIVNLVQIDKALLEQSVSKLDINRKTPLRKTMIELEHQQRQGKTVITQDHHAFVGSTQDGQNMNVTRQSFGVSSSRTSLFSPGSTLRGNSPGLGASQYEWSKQSIDTINKQANQLNEKRLNRRLISLDGERNYQPTIGSSMQGRQFNEVKLKEGGLILPDISPIQQNQTQYNSKFGLGQQSPLNSALGANKMSVTSTGGAGFSSKSNLQMGSNMRTLNPPSLSEVNGIGGGNRPPLYIPQKRSDTMRASNMQSSVSPMLQNQQIPTDQNKAAFTQFKQEFKSFGVGSEKNTFSSLYSNSENQVTNSGLQKKNTMNSNSVFKQQMPTDVKFESGVQRYKEGKDKKGIDEY